MHIMAASVGATALSAALLVPSHGRLVGAMAFLVGNATAFLLHLFVLIWIFFGNGRIPTETACGGANSRQGRPMTTENSTEFASAVGRLPQSWLLRGLWVSALGALGLLAGWFAESVVMSLALFSVFSIATIAVANRDKNLLHPLVAFPLFFYPYSTWHPYYSLINGTGDLNFLSHSVLYAFFGLLVFQVVGTLSLGWAKKIHVRPAITQRREPLVEKMLMWLGLAVVAFALRSIAGGGFASKRDIIDFQPTLLPVMSFMLWILTAVVLLVVVRWRFGGMRPDGLALAIFGLTVLV